MKQETRSGPGIAVNHLPDIRAEKSIFLFKTLLVNLLECFKTIFDTTVVSGILGLALSINIHRAMGGDKPRPYPRIAGIRVAGAEFVQSLHKSPVKVHKNIPGFVMNRIFRRKI